MGVWLGGVWKRVTKFLKVYYAKHEFNSLLLQGDYSDGISEKNF